MSNQANIVQNDIARAIYLVDANGNPITSNNALAVNATFSASSIAINDPTTTTNKATVDGSGNLHVAVGASLPAGSAIIGALVANQSVNLAQVGGSNVALGQAAMAASIPVVVASNQSAVPVSGTGNFNNASVGTDGSAIPTSSTLIGASDGTNLQQLLVESASNRNLRTALYNGANELGIDSGGRLTSIIQAVAGTALGTDQSGTQLKTSLYGKNSTAGDTAIKVNSSGDQYVLGDFLEVSFTTTTAQAVATTDVSSYKWVSVHITSQGTSSSITFQGSNDNTNWKSVTLSDIANNVNGTATNTTGTSIWHGPLGYRYFRLNVTGITAGTTAGVIEFYTSPTVMHSVGVIAAQSGTWTVQPGNTQNTTPWLVNTPSSDITVFASGAQTTTQTQADQTNNTARGIKVVLDMTNVAASPSVTLEIDGKDAASGKYYSILTGAAVTTVSTNVYTIYPGITASANVAANDVLPHTWRIKVTANNANSGTYSVGASLLP